MLAIAEALREEYLAIIDAGLILQVDDPFMIDLLMEEPRAGKGAPRRRAAHIEVVNHALRGIPPDRSGCTPATASTTARGSTTSRWRTSSDLMLDDRRRRATRSRSATRATSTNGGSGRTPSLPDGKILIPGFLCHAHNFVEHPQLIADGIIQYARLVGRENVIAGADCGFSSRAIYTPGGPPDGRLGEVRGARRGRAARERGAVAVAAGRTGRGAPGVGGGVAPPRDAPRAHARLAAGARSRRGRGAADRGSPHDIERAVPAAEEPALAPEWPATDYNDWHQDRSMRVAAGWLGEQGADPGLLAQVCALIRVHENGGSPDADLLQAADSLSFLEVQVETVRGPGAQRRDRQPRPRRSSAGCTSASGRRARRGAVGADARRDALAHLTAETDDGGE